MKILKHPQLFTKLSLILWAVFLFQYLEWVSVYWWEETNTIVSYSFLIVVVTEVLINKLLYKRLIQIIGVLSIHFFVLGIQTLEQTDGILLSLFQFLFMNIIHLHPYLWFSLIVACIYFTLILWANNLKRISMLIMITIFIFCSVDSFTIHILWDQVAFVIFSGLLLLIINHYHHFKSKHPKSWSEIMDYPESFVTPIIVFVSVTIIMGTLAPNFGPILTDPYTAWKNAKQAVAMGEGEGIILENATGSTSGYARYNERLGFGFEFDYSPVMEVESSQRSYWRGETRSYYNGLGWEPNLLENEIKKLVSTTDHNLLGSDEFNTSKLKTKKIEQRFKMLNKENYPVLFGAASIHKLLSVNNEQIENMSDAVMWDSNQQSLYWNRLEYPNSYMIVSDVPVIEPYKLKEASTMIESEVVMNAYLQLPETLPERVRELAFQITKSETNDYDKAKQIETYLSETFPYNNKPDVTKGKSVDFVDRFLFEIQEGYCDYYSTAMVVMARSLGIPARWVKGYTSGEENSDEFDSFVMEQLRQRNNLDEFKLAYTVLNSNAHSWVEVYFDGYGWIPFEPTAGFVIPEVYLSDGNSITDFNTNNVPENNQVSDGGFKVIEFALYTIGMIVTLIILLFLIVVKFKAIKLYFKKVINRIFRRKTNDKVIIEFERFLKFAYKKGFGKQEHETIRELINRWKSNYYWLEKDFNELLLIFERAKYSSFIIDADEANRASKIIRRLRKGFFK
ncbi:transglutaminase domain-containing protein [Chengkuizengella marina]|uniref:Transglutaminase domain-containing protein n=1 Tax=Chengkuizengella marina TaxID=2507566 RepID=A0A6N9Q3X9_9BACL|nr:transglutaminase domain-containing protein [Chengkuizengella marina]NBI29512.1 transglutaminase domain-containing protein [Chengkuizengella marina]